jgi:hypothetical protein
MHHPAAMPMPPDDPPARQTPAAPEPYSLNFKFGLGKQPPKDAPGSMRRFQWTLGSEEPKADAEPEPATYYEALTGRPDPMRGFFVTSRRILNVVTWIIALGIPVGLVTLGVVLGESSETIVITGIAGLIVGMMIKVSFPRTPFG